MQVATTILLLLAGMGFLVGVARRLGVPYPILLTIAGLGISFIPGLPKVTLDPNLVFLFFLPPILTAAAYFTPVRDFKANLRPILMLSLGLVLFTTLAVGWILHLFFPFLPLAVCFTVGAIVAPPDAIAATSIAERLGLPHRVVTVLEGESLVNDSTALIAYRFAVTAALTGAFSWQQALSSFFITSIGGIVIGIALGLLMSWVSIRMQDSTMLIMFTLINTFAAYLIAEAFHLSGVLSCVTTGLVYGYKSACVMTPRARVEGEAIWGMVIFIINGVAFSLIGLQLPTIISTLNQPFPVIAGTTAVAILATILTRVVWMWPAVYLPRVLSRKLAQNDPAPPHSVTFVLAWAGMRGIVSLAAALALPENFPYRNLVTYLTFAVVIATLVGQGLSLYVIIPKLGLSQDDQHEREEAMARVLTAEASIARLEALAEEDWVHAEHLDYFRGHYSGHRERHSFRVQGETHDELETKVEALHRLRMELLNAEQEALIMLRNSGKINDQVMRTIQRDLDLQSLHR
jgi:monovalent cation/hydrogen antiporter